MNGQGVKKKEDMYIVLKVSDVEGLSKRQRRDLDSIQEQIAIMRRRQGRPDDNRYITCNRDEPYAERVWNEILKGERAKVAKTTAPKMRWGPVLCDTVGCIKPATTGVRLKDDRYTEFWFCDDHAKGDDVQDHWPLLKGDMRGVNTEVPGGTKITEVVKVERSIIVPDGAPGSPTPPAPATPQPPPATDTKEGA
jgi:hypothetical protein